MHKSQHYLIAHWNHLDVVIGMEFDKAVSGVQISVREPILLMRENTAYVKAQALLESILACSAELFCHCGWRNEEQVIAYLDLGLLDAERTKAGLCLLNAVLR